MAMYGATIGQLGILAQPTTTNQACCALLSKDNVFKHSFIFSFLKENREKIISLGMGAAQQNISQQVIKKFELLRPLDGLVEQFNKMVDPILENIRMLQEKNTTLRQTRDLLLPRLISGAVDVSDMEIDLGKN